MGEQKAPPFGPGAQTNEQPPPTARNTKKEGKSFPPPRTVKKRLCPIRFSDRLRRFIDVKKSFQGVINIPFLFHNIIPEFLVLDMLIGGHQGGIAMILIHFPVTEQIGHIHDLPRQFDAAGVVAR